MKTQTRPLLVLFLLVLSSLACLGGGNGFIIPPSTLENKQVTCKRLSFFQPEYDCTCKSDGTVKVIKMVTEMDTNFNLNENFTIDGCPIAPLTENAQALPTEEPTEAPTDAPTEAPTDAPTEELLKPYLTGSASACDLTNRFINFTIADTAPVLDTSNLTVTVGGQPAKCSVPAGNPGVLTCTFAPDTDFPAQVSVSLNGAELNNFAFDGGICFFSDPPPPANNDDNPPPPDPCAGVLTPTASCP